MVDEVSIRYRRKIRTASAKPFRINRLEHDTTAHIEIRQSSLYAFGIKADNGLTRPAEGAREERCHQNIEDAAVTRVRNPGC